MEKFYGWACKVKDGVWASNCPVVLRNMEDMRTFILENILDSYEIRITDGNDSLCMHIVDREQLFPKIPEFEDVPNKWDPIIGKFVPEGVTRPETEGEKFARRNGLMLVK